MSKVYPLEIEEVFGTHGDPIGWRSKGHHDPVVFLNACNDYEVRENDNDGALDLVNEEDVKQGWYRTVPAGEGYDLTHFFKKESGPGPGIYPATTLLEGDL